MPFHEQQLYNLQQKYNDCLAMDIKEEKIKESRERERERERDERDGNKTRGNVETRRYFGIKIDLVWYIAQYYVQ